MKAFLGYIFQITSCFSTTTMIICFAFKIPECTTLEPASNTRLLANTGNLWLLLNCTSEGKIGKLYAFLLVLPEGNY